MSIALVGLFVVVVFLALLFLGRAQIAKGSNPQVANGAVLLTLAAIAGLLAVGALASLGGW